MSNGCIMMLKTNDGSAVLAGHKNFVIPAIAGIRISREGDMPLLISGVFD
jgi:hypothetical protein